MDNRIDKIPKQQNVNLVNRFHRYSWCEETRKVCEGAYDKAKFIINMESSKNKDMSGNFTISIIVRCLLLRRQVQ